MPVPVEKLVEPEKPLEQGILEFLRKTPALAFTIWEIVKAVGEMDEATFGRLRLIRDSKEPGEYIHLYLTSLIELERRGEIRSRDYESEVHYFVAPGPGEA